MKKAVLLITVVLLVISLSACGAIRDKIVSGIKSAVAEVSLAPDVTEKAEEPTAAPDETAAPEESAAAEETTEPEATEAVVGIEGFWPDAIPEYIPKFSYGAYVEKDSGKMEYDGSLIVTMNFINVARDQMDKYVDALKQAGFETTKTDINGELLVSGTLKKDKKESTLLIGWQKGGVCSYVLTIVAETK